MYGRRLFGYCNSVPHVFHVRTVFFHICFLPLWPTQSYLFFDGDRDLIPNQTYLILDGDKGIKIPLNAKSIALAWLRGITFVTAFVSFASVIYANSSGITILVFLVSSILTCYLMWHKSNTLATYENATAICSSLNDPGLKNTLQGEVDGYFNALRYDTSETELEETYLQPLLATSSNLRSMMIA